MGQVSSGLELELGNYLGSLRGLVEKGGVVMLPNCLKRICCALAGPFSCLEFPPYNKRLWVLSGRVMGGSLARSLPGSLSNQFLKSSDEDLKTKNNLLHTGGKGN